MCVPRTGRPAAARLRLASTSRRNCAFSSRLSLPACCCVTAFRFANRACTSSRYRWPTVKGAAVLELRPDCESVTDERGLLAVGALETNATRLSAVPIRCVSRAEVLETEGCDEDLAADEEVTVAELAGTANDQDCGALKLGGLAAAGAWKTLSAVLECLEPTAEGSDADALDEEFAGNDEVTVAELAEAAELNCGALELDDLSESEDLTDNERALARLAGCRDSEELSPALTDEAALEPFSEWRRRFRAADGDNARARLADGWYVASSVRPTACSLSGRNAICALPFDGRQSSFTHAGNNPRRLKQK